MSYFIKYKLPFVSDRGNVYDLHILQKNYAGQPIVKKLGVAPVLSIEDGEGRVKGSSLSFAVQADVEGELKGLYTTNNKEFKVLLYRNSSLYWQGFVLPELYSENYIDPPYDVAVTASDQLGVLKNVEYKQEAGYKSLLEIIAYTLSLTDLDLKIVQHLNLTLSGNERFLDGAYVATEGYYGQSCYDVLNSILLSCNACIQQYGNEWVIMSLTDVSTSYNKDGVNIEIPHAQLGQMGSAQVYPDGSLEMVNKPAVKGVTLNYAHVLKNSFLKNADCQSKDGWQYSFEPLDNRLPGTIDEFGVIYKCNCWQLPQKDVTVSGELQLWQDINVKADNTYNCQLSVDYRMDLGASLLLMAIIHEGVDGITRRLTSEGWKEGVSDTDRNSYINVTGTPSGLWLTWAKDIADFSKYEKTTVQFRLPAVDGVLRIGFINTSETSFVDPLSGYVYITKVYLTYMGITGKASTTVVEENATNAQEEISLAYGERVPATNEALAVLNTLRSASGVPREQFSLNNTSGVKSYDSYFLAMLQEMSRYYAVKKMHLQGIVMGVSPLHLLYKDVFSGKVMRLVSGEYDLLQDTLGVLLEEVPDAWVDYEPEVYATDNSVPGVSSSGVVTVGGGGGTSLLAVNAKGEVYVKDERVLSGAEADFGKVVLPAEKPEGSSDKVYIYSQVPAADEQLDNKAVNVHLMVDELVELRDDFDALNDLLNSDVAGVINTWDEIVDFLNEYGESQDLASILSQMNTDIANRVSYTDFEKLEDAVDSNYKSISNIASTIPTIESNISTLATRVSSAESVITTIQSTYVDKASAQEINGVKTFKNGLKIGDAELVWDNTNKALKIVGSAYITKDLSFGGYQAPGGGGTSGGGIVTIKVNGQEYTSQNGIVTLPNYPSLAGYATEEYVTSRGYITNAALNGYAKLTDIPTSLPASDVYAWAKAATKPTYTASEVGALSTSGGTISSSHYQPLIINSTYSAVGDVRIAFSYNGDIKGLINWDSTTAFRLYNNVCASYIGVKDDGTPCYNDYTLYHSGNFNPANYLPLTGGTISNNTTPTPLVVNSNTSVTAMRLTCNSANKIELGWDGSTGTYLFNYASSSYLSIKDDGTPTYNGNTLYHTGNFNPNDYLPLSGGTLNSVSYSPLIIDTTNSQNRIQFKVGGVDKALVGWNPTYGAWLYNYPGNSYLHIKDDGTPCYNGNTLIHSGNIGSQVVEGINTHTSSAINAGGDIAKLNSYYEAGIFKISRFNGLGGLGTANSDGLIVNWPLDHAYGQQWYIDDESHTIQTRYVAGGSWSSFKTIAFTDSNVASATKLQTARTIWGQSFDGSANVSGVLSDVNQVTFDANKSYGIFRGDWVSAALTRTDLVFYAPKFHFNTGNVLIGTTTDNGDKLQVNGGITTYGSINLHSVGEIQNALAISRYDNGTGYYVGSRNAVLGVADGGCLVYAYGNTPISLYTNGSERVRISGGGPVIINSNTRFDSGLIFMNDSSEGIYIHGSGINFHNSNNAWVASCLSFDYYGNTTLYHNLTVTGDITSEGTMAMAKLASSSDRKLKDNIAEVSAEQSMSIIRQLRPTTWNWKKDGKKSYGFIAQDVQPIIPEMVSSVNDTLRLEYNQLHAFEIGAIQHIDSEVEILKRDLKNANNRIELLENELKQYRRNA